MKTNKGRKNSPEMPATAEATETTIPEVKLTYVPETDQKSTQILPTVDDFNQKAAGVLTTFSVNRILSTANDTDKYTGFKLKRLNTLATAAKATCRIGANTTFGYVRELSMILASVKQSDLKAEKLKNIGEFAAKIGLPDNMSGAAVSNLTTYGRMQLDVNAPDQLKRMTPSNFAALSVLMKDPKTKARLYKDATDGKLDGITQADLRKYKDTILNKKDKQKAEVIDDTPYLLTVIGETDLIEEALEREWHFDEIETLVDELKAKSMFVTLISDAPIDGLKTHIYNVTDSVTFKASTFIFKAKPEPKPEPKPATTNFIDLSVSRDVAIRSIMTMYGFSETKATMMYDLMMNDDNA